MGGSEPVEGVERGGEFWWRVGPAGGHERAQDVVVDLGVDVGEQEPVAGEGVAVADGAGVTRTNDASGRFRSCAAPTLNVTVEGACREAYAIAASDGSTPVTCPAGPAAAASFFARYPLLDPTSRTESPSCTPARETIRQ